MAQELSLGLRDELERWDGAVGGREASEGGDVRMHVALLSKQQKRARVYLIQQNRLTCAVPFLHV